MTAAVEAPDPLAEQKKRLERAAWELDAAADRAREAIAELEPEGVRIENALPLIEAIQRAHADEHDGPFRWCTHPVCQQAQA